MHLTPLIATIAAGISLAFLLGLPAQRLRISPLIGYLAARRIFVAITDDFDRRIAGARIRTRLSRISRPRAPTASW